jgi:hypothetical protein
MRTEPRVFNGTALLLTFPNIQDSLSLPYLPQESIALILLELTLTNFSHSRHLTFDVARGDSMSSTFGPCSLLDLPAEIRIGITNISVRTGLPKRAGALGTSRGGVPVNLAFRCRALKKIPTEILKACTQVKAEAEPQLYQGNKLFFETFTLLNVFCERIPSEKLSLHEVSLSMKSFHGYTSMIG